MTDISLPPRNESHYGRTPSPEFFRRLRVLTLTSKIVRGVVILRNRTWKYVVFMIRGTHRFASQEHDRFACPSSKRHLILPMQLEVYTVSNSRRSGVKKCAMIFWPVFKNCAGKPQFLIEFLSILEQKAQFLSWWVASASLTSLRGGRGGGDVKMCANKKSLKHV